MDFTQTQATDRMAETDTALERLYRDHAAWLLRLAVRLTGRIDTAEELVQEAFLRMAQQPDAGRLPENPRAWLCRVTVNLWRDRLRRLRWRRFLPLACSPDMPDGRDMEADFMDQDRVVKVRQALSRLPDRDRLLIVLYWDEMSYAEMARVLDLRVTTVGKALSRAIDRLAALLE
ncbi:MAG TPA: sigma-70 family RNA polymerase sigma factor [Acidobacteriota bacterium]|nr:sigma-70 family RNA polymerase sigma factor [Acidobacteriota bacterium]HQM62797.1 sigma-70 family RNA polymerase sigma factor [Acidobacteriota bacterium]